MNGIGEGVVTHCQGRPSREKSRAMNVWLETRSSWCHTPVVAWSSSKLTNPHEMGNSIPTLWMRKLRLKLSNYPRPIVGPKGE